MQTGIFVLLLNVSAMIVVQAQPPDPDRTPIVQEITPSIIPRDPVPKAVEPERLNRQELPEKMRRSVKPLLEPFRQRWFPPIDKLRWRPPTELASYVMAERADESFTFRTEGKADFLVQSSSHGTSAACAVGSQSRRQSDVWQIPEQRKLVPVDF